ncbi:MAG: hypothetical protein D6675_16190 [Gemmatimonadetes bacterium]|nr:MAG: hypothetical protein D6675_16190 [Gemmatimonadota bacterium]
MARWDMQGLEIFPDLETPQDVMRSLGQYEANQIQCGHYTAYHLFQHEGRTYLHLGWNAARSSVAYHTLKQFAERTGRNFISAYAEPYSRRPGSLYRIFYSNRQPEFYPYLKSRF